MTVVRRLPNDQQILIRVDLNEAFRDMRENIIVKAGRPRRPAMQTGTGARPAQSPTGPPAVRVSIPVTVPTSPLPTHSVPSSNDTARAPCPVWYVATTVPS